MEPVFETDASAFDVTEKIATAAEMPTKPPASAPASDCALMSSIARTFALPPARIDPFTVAVVPSERGRETPRAPAVGPLVGAAPLMPVPALDRPPASFWFVVFAPLDDWPQSVVLADGSVVVSVVVPVAW